MLTKQQQHLLSQLHLTRSNLRQDILDETGKSTAVLCDEALIAIAQLMPTSIEDLEAIPTIGKVTANRYGDKFLATVKQHLDDYRKDVTAPLSGNIKGILKTLERKLVGLNRRNKLLYMPVIKDKSAFDLTLAAKSDAIDKLLFSSRISRVNIGLGDTYTKAAGVVNTLDAEALSGLEDADIIETNENIGSGSTFELEDEKTVEDMDSISTEPVPKKTSARTSKSNALAVPADSVAASVKPSKAQKRTRKASGSVDLFGKVSRLLREVSRLARENGSFDLYIGYPYAEGRLLGTDFFIKAPLALFPVKVEKTGKDVTFELDRSKNVLYNTNLLLATGKINSQILALESDSIDEIDAVNFVPKLVEFYRAKGLDISFDGKCTSEGFVDSAGGLPRKYKQGEMCVRGYCVLGRFALADTAVQRDFANIISRDNISKSITELLEGSEDCTLGRIIEQDTTTELDALKEDDILYINALNASQERVIQALKTRDRLVVYGPPGTGKSQTITSVIADFVGRNQSVLMVSEKKAALDVIYSRLGLLSDYALQIDDIEDKSGFYNQIIRTLDIDSNRVKEPQKNISLAPDIESNLKALDIMAEKLYAESNIGEPMYRLYRENSRIELDNIEEKQKFYDVRELTTAAPEIERKWYQKKIEPPVRYPSLMKTTLSKHRAMKTIFVTAESDELISEWLPKWDKAYLSHAVKTHLSAFDLTEANELFDFICVQYKLLTITPWHKRGALRRALYRRIKQDAPKFINFKFDKRGIEDVCSQAAYIQSCLTNYSDYLRAVKLIDSLDAVEIDCAHLLVELKDKWRVDMQSVSDFVYRAYCVTKINEFETMNGSSLETMSVFSNIIIRVAKLCNTKQDFVRNLLYYTLAQNFSSISKSKRYGDMRRLAESSRKPSIVRYVNRFDNELFLGVKIWLMTPEVASQLLPLQEGLFDLVVFDEASQMYVERAIPSLVRAKKVLIAGDSKQLRPSSLGVGRVEIDEELLEEEGNEVTALEVDSLLDLAESKYEHVMLDCHYRSRYEELIAFSNAAFYKGKLLVSPNIAAVSKPIEVRRVKGGKWIERSNVEEAKAVVKLIREIFETRRKGESIGIITFNSTQRDKIEELFEEECARDTVFAETFKSELERSVKGEDIGLFVKNIENVQGDERDIIIFSVGYAPNEQGKIVRQFGWLNCGGGENRLNVAITRAKQKVFVVTSINPHELDVDDLANDGPKLLRKYMEYADAIDRGDSAQVKAILSRVGVAAKNKSGTCDKDALVDEISDELRAQGLNVDNYIGIGSYVIDIAVKDSDGNYTLGIECDERVYSDATLRARERDYHRQMYMMSRGWRLYRVFSSRWYASRETELAAIQAVINT